jgi:hypothetical protein
MCLRVNMQDMHSAPGRKLRTYLAKSAAAIAGICCWDLRTPDEGASIRDVHDSSSVFKLSSDTGCDAYVCIYACIYVCAHVRVCVCVCIYIYIYIYIYSFMYV